MTGTRMRMAVAEEEKEDKLAPRLGRALKFALFDVAGKEIRGPFYRVRHDNPGVVCSDHKELARLLHDCKVVIAGSVGSRMAKRLHELGIEVVATTERKPAIQLVARHLAGNLEREEIKP
jgi:predicted Fe-Mo cluster-binding NifX family protein